MSCGFALRSWRLQQRNITWAWCHWPPPPVEQNASSRCRRNPMICMCFLTFFFPVNTTQGVRIFEMLSTLRSLHYKNSESLEISIVSLDVAPLRSTRPPGSPQVAEAAITPTPGMVYAPRIDQEIAYSTDTFISFSFQIWSRYGEDQWICWVLWLCFDCFKGAFKSHGKPEASQQASYTWLFGFKQA